jgi:hypothetical protein
MAGGQQITVSQGTLTPRTSGQYITVGQGSIAVVAITLALTGQALASSAGFVSSGPATNEAITGSASTVSQGTGVGAMLVRLHSRKVGGGSSTRSLTSVSASSSAGTALPDFGPTPASLAATASAGSPIQVRTVPLIGTAIPASTGTLTFSSQAEPTWVGLVPTVEFTQGQPDDYALTQHTLSFNSTLHEFEVLTGTLPSGVTLEPSTGLVYDGVGAVASVSGISYNIADIATTTLQQDWIARSTASGVTAAYDFNGVNDFLRADVDNGHVYAGSMNPTVLGYIVKDTTDGLASGCCLRIDTPASVGANSATWMCSLNNSWTTKTQGFGSTAFWIQFRFKIPSSRLTLTNCGGNQRGWKWANIAHYSQIDPAAQSASNRNDEHVLQDTNQYGFPQAYHRDVNGNFPAFNESYGGSNFKLQNSIDNGTGLSDNNRYCLWNNGSPSAGCWDWVTDEWLTCMIRIKVGTYGGSAGNEFDMWVARRLATSWTHTHSFSNYSVGLPDEFTGGLNGLHLLTYETNRLNSTVATHHKYAELIVSTQEIALPAPI